MSCSARRRPARHPDAATTGDPAFNSPWSYTGLPTVSLPAGWSADGLPLAIQLVGPPWQEAELLAAAAMVRRGTWPSSGANRRPEKFSAASPERERWLRSHRPLRWHGG